MIVHSTHNIRTDDDEKSYCLRCGHAGKELKEECPDLEPYFDEDHYPEFYTGNYDE